MAKRDLLDDIIDIQEDWRAVSTPIGNVAQALVAEPKQEPVFDPANYKERPRVNSGHCLCTSFEVSDACSMCMDVCPVDAITIEKQNVKVNDDCLRCGLCVTVCPTAAFTSAKLAVKGLYDKIARMASTYEKCYITCTRAIKRVPLANEVVLPCVGAMPEEVWFALLADYPNLSVYLPLGICDRCRTITGEDVLTECIAAAEEKAGVAVGLDVDEADLTHEQSRAYKRTQFVSNAMQAGQNLMMARTPVLAGAKAVAERIRQHSDQLTRMQRQLDEMIGDKNSESKRRILTQKRKLVLTALQSHPYLARGFDPQVPDCDPLKCTMCGECVRGCPVHACDLGSMGLFSVEPTQCVWCGACARACPEDALTMLSINPEQIVIPDPEAERRERQARERKEAAEAAKRKLKKGLAALERLDTGEDE